ncbi:hypothetical protein [Bradyrhizobium cenepequi]|nr:hypothetical protein [Bradyrhizobium cenepequi]
MTGPISEGKRARQPTPLLTELASALISAELDLRQQGGEAQWD